VAILKIMIAGLVLVGLGLIAGGVWRLHQIDTGTKVSATVSECHHISGLHGGSTVCTGSWVTGNLLAGGHVVLGSINGVGPGDVNKKVTVRVHGGSAYVHSLKAPIAFFSVAGACFVLAIVFVWGMVAGWAYGPTMRAQVEAKKAESTT
jgi:hypothetical protein